MTCKKYIYAAAGIILAAAAAIILFNGYDRASGEGVRAIDGRITAIGGTLFEYHEFYHEYPQGGNREVTQALLARDNKGRKAFLEPRAKDLNQQGELLDTWGIPFYIKIEGEQIEIRSAGPDGKLWTSDDVLPRGEAR